MSPAFLQKIRDKFDHYYAGTAASGSRLYPQVKETLAALAAAGANPEMAALTAEAAGGQHFADKASLLAALPALLNAHQDLVLLAKGARSSKMEDIIEFARSFKEQAC